jgi:hypothetical protein
MILATFKVEINLKHFNGANNTVYPTTPHELQRQLTRDKNSITKFYNTLNQFNRYLSHQRF